MVTTVDVGYYEKNANDRFNTLALQHSKLWTVASLNEFSKELYMCHV